MTNIQVYIRVSNDDCERVDALDWLVPVGGATHTFLASEERCKELMHGHRSWSFPVYRAEFDVAVLGTPEAAAIFEAAARQFDSWALPGVDASNGWVRGADGAVCYAPASVRAVLECCANGHAVVSAVEGTTSWGLAKTDANIIENCRAALRYLDYAGSPVGSGSYRQAGRRERMAAAADRLRDFMTVELLCEGLGERSPRVERRMARL